MPDGGALDNFLEKTGLFMRPRGIAWPRLNGGSTIN
nr:MAG TPA: hypothetical protein [Caudoviricetes sp.]